MIRSMTGFGRAQVAGDKLVVSVEARSVNHRHLDISIKLPRLAASLESEARRVIQERLQRGRIDVTAGVSAVAREPAQQVTFDVPLARAYVEASRRLAAELAIAGDPPLAWVLDRPGVVQVEDAEPPPADVVWPLLEAALGRALDELVERRETEGEALAAALRDLHEGLVREVERIGSRVPQAAARRRERFEERLRALLGVYPIDESRVLTEVAMWAEKTDITEELTRLRAHFEQFALMLKDGGPVGRPLDFLIQEMNRELNTVASKADDLELSQSAITAKGLLEKVREQVQNLE
jgi:uncharacterized protein (TIGR00255 family)